MITKNIALISNEPWGDIWYSKHHYANELSKRHNVFFIDPPKKWQFSNLFYNKVKMEVINERLRVVHYKNILPHFFYRINNLIVSKKLKKFFKANNSPIDIFWSFDPIRLFEPKKMGANFSIFHVVDKYKNIHKSEELFNKNVDLFISVSKDFIDRYKIYNKRILSIPHGISKDEFEIDDSFPIPFSNYGVYIGTIDLRLDYNFLVKLIERFPNQQFVFVGKIIPTGDKNQERIFINHEFKNVVHVPPIHAKKLKYYIHFSSFCMAPMIKSYDGNLISHHKIFQYLAHGKPTFSPEFTEYISISNLLYMNNSDDKLISLLENYFENGEDSNLLNERIKFALQNTYDSHIKNIFDVINE